MSVRCNGTSCPVWISPRSMRNAAAAASRSVFATPSRNFSGDGENDGLEGKGLQISEDLIFEQDSGRSICAVDCPELGDSQTKYLPVELRRSAIGFPGLTEPTVMRHYVRLSNQNYNIESGMYPLGSCTMKYNPRLNELVASIPGFADVHPLQPEETVQGWLASMWELQEWLLKLCGMSGITLTPAAGSHGELAGMLAIKAKILHDGEAQRNIVLMPDAAHGTNPATAVMAGFKTLPVKSDPKTGRLDMRDFHSKLSNKVAALMLTNPNTCGIFEDDVCEISSALHKNGSYFYMDGANMNSFLGRFRPGDAGVDCMHMNLHKTFSTPHGGGGPGSGPVVYSDLLAAYAPTPRIVKDLCSGTYQIQESDPDGLSLGRIKGFLGQSLVNLRALCFLVSLGLDGLRGVSEAAVLNANYLRAGLSDVLSLSFPDSDCMHEVLFDDAFLKGTGLTTMDLAKALLDEGFHPWTMYFPLVVHGALLMEPTESETKESLDKFINVVRKLVKRAKSGDAKVVEHMKNSPHTTPIGRANEILAAKIPILTYNKDFKQKFEKQKQAVSSIPNNATSPAPTCN